MKRPLLKKTRAQSGKTLSSTPNWVYVVSGFGLAAVVATVVTLVVTLPAPSLIPPLEFPNYTDTIYQQHACECKTDWNLATNERLISNEVFAQTMSEPDPVLSSFAGFWGQFVDHDIVLSQSDPSLGYFEIPLVPGSRILNITRNAFVEIYGCRSAVNTNTPWLDGSTVYGDALKPDLIDDLRVAGECELLTSAGNLLPLAPGNMSYLAGDDRNSETVVLTSLHTLFVREHNRLCSRLAVQFPTWTNEQRFWKARQIVVAKIQRITYEEWLPLVLGSTRWNGPLKRTDPQMTSEFSVGAYRIGHSMIPAQIGDFPLEELFFNVTKLQVYGLEPFLQAAYTTPMEKADAKVVDALRNFLFGPEVGEDLVTRNLFRAREQELQTYSVIANCYGNTNPQAAPYPDPHVGLFGEATAPGSSLPLTVGLIWSEQFQRIAKYDPYFYTKIRGDLGAFYAYEVDRTSLGQVIRDNTELESVPVNVFRL